MAEKQQKDQRSPEKKSDLVKRRILQVVVRLIILAVIIFFAVSLLKYIVELDRSIKSGGIVGPSNILK